MTKVSVPDEFDKKGRIMNSTFRLATVAMALVCAHAGFSQQAAGQAAGRGQQLPRG
jgi:hypothetical protein